MYAGGRRALFIKGGCLCVSCNVYSKHSFNWYVIWVKGFMKANFWMRLLVSAASPRLCTHVRPKKLCSYIHVLNSKKKTKFLAELFLTAAAQQARMYSHWLHILCETCAEFTIFFYAFIILLMYCALCSVALTPFKI